MTNYNRVKAHLEKYGRITIRQMAVDFYINSPYPIIQQIMRDMHIVIIPGYNKRTRRHYKIYSTGEYE